jgi:hypothetical protein
MRGAGKVHGSLVREAKPKNQRVTIRKKKSRQVRNRLLPKYGLSQKNRLYTLKKKLEEEDPSDKGLIKNFLRTIRFIKLFTKHYDTVIESNNENKSLNYSLFASILASKILSVINEYYSIVDNKLFNNNNNNNVKKLLKDPNEFLEDFVEYIEEHKIADKFTNYAIKYFKKSQPNRMSNESIEELEENYKEYQGLLEDTVAAVKNTIKEYSLDERVSQNVSQKMEVNNDLNDLISGLSVMKVNESNNKLNEDLYSMFNKLGL